MHATGKKPTTYNDPACRWLVQLSKAALVDCVVDLLRTTQDSADNPVGENAARDRLGTVLAMRGDKSPKTTADISGAFYNKMYSRSHGTMKEEVDADEPNAGF